MKNPKPLTFNEWFNETYPVSEVRLSLKDYINFKKAMRRAWKAGIDSTEEMNIANPVTMNEANTRALFESVL
jgi:hypothetical protein